MQTFHIEQKYFDAIKNGSKKHEGKSITSRMVETTTVGDKIIIFTGSPKMTNETTEDHYKRHTDMLYVKIINKIEFQSIHDMLKQIGATNLLPELLNYDNDNDKDIDIIEIGYNIYLNWIKPTDKVCAVEFEIIK
jgi:ASC-1-like (ASCH) protein